MKAMRCMSQLCCPSPLTSELNNQHSLVKEWREWAQAGQPKKGERRDIALSRLTDYLASNQSDLCLSYLNLTQLPDAFPPQLKVLDVSGNRLVNLPPQLPDTLAQLDVSHNRLTHLPASLPRSLHTLVVKSNALLQLPNNLPVGLERLDVTDNLLSHRPVSLPPSLHTLLIENNALIPDDLVASLEKVDIGENKAYQFAHFLPSTSNKVAAVYNRADVSLEPDDQSTGSPRNSED